MLFHSTFCIFNWCSSCNDVSLYPLQNVEFVCLVCFDVRLNQKVILEGVNVEIKSGAYRRNSSTNKVGKWWISSKSNWMVEWNLQQNKSIWGWKNCLKARLEKLSLAHEEKTKKKETKREKYQLEKSLAEEPKIETSRLKMRSKFIRKDWRDNNKQGYMKSKAIRSWNKKIERKTPTLVKVLGKFAVEIDK